MRRRFRQEAIFLVNPCKDADHPEHTGPLSGLQIQPGIAHVENFPHVGNSSCLHGAKDHVWCGPPFFYVITADIRRESALPVSGPEYLVDNCSIEARGGSTDNAVCFEPSKGIGCSWDRFDSAI